MKVLATASLLAAVAVESFAAVAYTSTDTTTTPSPTPTILNPYRNEGCFNDSNNRRVLQGAFHNSFEMQVQLCDRLCKKYNYFGLEFQQQCFCGNQVLNEPVLAPASHCHEFQCPGNDKEYCGGTNFIELYARREIPPPSSRAPAPTSTAA